MKVEILGSGGAATIPRPGCACRVCAEARARGWPYTRTGPSTFVHGPNVVFDTPEESKAQIERAGLGEIAACFYSHDDLERLRRRLQAEGRHVRFAHDGMAVDLP